MAIKKNFKVKNLSIANLHSIINDFNNKFYTTNNWLSKNFECKTKKRKALAIKEILKIVGWIY